MLEVRGLVVTYGDFVAVGGLDLSVGKGAVQAILGPSGCGKSTLLRAIAGLEPAAAGTVRLEGEDVTAWRPDRRGVGLMFQDHVLFPHRTVGDNVAFGPRMRGLPRAETAERVTHALALVDLDGAQHRPVAELSGGEQQRVALARAIAPRPRLLMLDEPLGSLDRTLRDRLLVDLPRLLAEVGTTTLYVTHDQEEALTLADDVAVMRAGRIEQEGRPEEVWHRPRSEFVARFVGLETILDAEVRGGVADSPLGRLPMPGEPDGHARLVLLAGGATLLDADEPPGGRPVVDARIVVRRFAGDRVVVRARTVDGVTLVVPVPDVAGIEVGAGVRVAIDPTAVHRLSG